jgi:phosphoribosylformylglycinamidine cyclo-ligase
MCVNDVIVQGAEPLFFLDYFATGKLEVDVSAKVVTGIADGCKLSGAALIGGETAEMPGMYADGEYDLAGFCVAIAEKSELITGQTIKADDIVIGLHSSGVHSNGFSLVNKVLEVSNSTLEQEFAGSTLGETLLTPTKIYVKPILEMIKKSDIHGLCHVTGGGITENLPRILPDNLCAEIDPNSWQRLPIFDWIQEQGNIADEEMLRVFNSGIGMIVVVAPEQQDVIMQLAHQHQIDSSVIGVIKNTSDSSQVRYI